MVVAIVSTFSEWLTREMKRRDWANADLVRAARVPQSAVSNWLNNDVIPSYDSTVKVADALGVPRAVALRASGRIPGPGDEPPLASPSNDPIVEEAVRIARELHEDPVRYETWIDIGETLLRRKRGEE